MKVLPRPIAGLHEVSAPPAYRDERGSLRRIYDSAIFREAGIDAVWRQQSLSHTGKVNVLRGLHLQLPPFSEAKLVTILAGRMFWAAVDIRRGSPTFGRHETFDLTPDGPNGFFAARGFAHGCLSLSADTILVISSDNVYSREHGRGIAWNDPDLAIDWPVLGKEMTISAEHGAYPSFRSFRELHGGI